MVGFSVPIINHVATNGLFMEALDMRKRFAFLHAKTAEKANVMRLLLCLFMNTASICGQIIK